MKDFVEDIREVINRHSREIVSNMPDFILAQFINATLEAFEQTTNTRREWYNITPFAPASKPGPCDKEETK
jgi:hypothetical protein